MTIDYNQVVIGLIAVLVCITMADHAVIEFNGQINEGGELTFFLGTVTIDHTGDGTSLEIDYSLRDSQERWVFRLDKNGEGELEYEGEKYAVETEEGFFGRKEVADLVDPLNKALELPEPGLEMKEDSTGTPGLYHFSYEGKTVLSLQRHTDPRGHGAPLEATLNLDSGVQINVKFGSVDPGEGK
jgi:hypothetical protein